MLCFVLIQTDEQRQKLKNKYSKEKLYIVVSYYVANERLCQLSQNINDLVAVVKPYDPSSQKHIWLVDNGGNLNIFNTIIVIIRKDELKMNILK